MQLVCVFATIFYDLIATEVLPIFVRSRCVSKTYDKFNIKKETKK